MVSRIRAFGLGLLSVGLAVTAVPAAHAEPDREGEPAGIASAVAAPKAVSVTLLTGDRVVLVDGDQDRVAITPAEGSQGRTFQRFTVGGHLYVVPSDLRAQFGNGTIDRRLFDITGLIAVGYDDANADTIPLIVRHVKGAGAAGGMTSAMTGAGATAGRELTSIDGAAFSVDKGETARFFDVLPRTDAGFAEGVKQIWLDGRSRVSLDQSVPQIGAPDAWEAGYTGSGTTVAVIDTGVNRNHPDLSGKIARRKDFTGEGLGDGFGHGTHVASTIAGSGSASGGRYQGVAPDAALLDGKVCDSGGWCEDSAIIAGMEWATAAQGADVVNLSLGGTDTPEIDPLEAAVNSLTASTGALFVVAAGNEGPWAQTIGSPGSADAALTVGAVDKSDQLADFSSRGPRVGDGAIKPDLTAPGVAIVAARAAGTTMGTPVGENYVSADGTSMATPHVAGAAALLAQQHPAWQPEQLKAALVGSTEPNPTLGAFEQGSGRVDLTRAIAQDVIAEPASISFGRAAWPHDDDEPVTKTLTYRNLGDAAVTLDLEATFAGPDGDAPDGALTLSQDSVTVPAGGTASVDLTSDTDHAGKDGAYSGRVTASAGGARVSTAVAVDKEVESYELTLRGIGRDGHRSPMSAMVFGLETDYFAFPEVGRNKATIRLPKGRYAVSADIAPASYKHLSLMVQPVLNLTRDMVWTADARRAKPVSMTVSNRSVRTALVDIGFQVESDERAISSSYWLDKTKGLYAGHVGPKVPKGRFAAVGLLGVDWAVPAKNGWFHNSPLIYKIADSRPGRFWDGYKRSFRDRDLATLKTRFNAQVPKRRGYTAIFGFLPGSSGASSAGFSYDLPAAATVRLSPGAVNWYQDFGEFTRRGEVTYLTQTKPSRFAKGTSYRSRFNGAPFGPGPVTAMRFESFLGISAPLYSDQDGHAGVSAVDKAFTTLHRGDELLARTDHAGYVTYDGAGLEKATYRVTTAASRPSYSRLSTRQRAEWTFTSGVLDQGSLPIWTATLRPKVDAHNRSDRAKATVPLRFQAPKRAKVGKLTTVKVRVSGDAGKSWKKATVRATGKNAYAVTVPRQSTKASSVSVEITASDSRGNSVKQLTIRAYRLK